MATTASKSKRVTKKEVMAIFAEQVASYVPETYRVHIDTVYNSPLSTMEKYPELKRNDIYISNANCGQYRSWKEIENIVGAAGLTFKYYNFTYRSHLPIGWEDKARMVITGRKQSTPSQNPIAKAGDLIKLKPISFDESQGRCSKESQEALGRDLLTYLYKIISQTLKMARDRQLEAIIDNLLSILEVGTGKEDRVLESIRGDQTIFDFEVQVEEAFGFLFERDELSIYEEETVLDLAKKIQECFG